MTFSPRRSRSSSRMRVVTKMQTSLATMKIWPLSVQNRSRCAASGVDARWSRTLRLVCPRTFIPSATSRPRRATRRHGARPHATAGSCFGGRLDWCRRLPSRCVSSLTATTARSSHLCPPRAGRVEPIRATTATPSRRSRPLGRCGRRDDVHAALPRRFRSATPRFLLGAPRALLSPSRALSAPRSGASGPICASPFQPRLPLAARARQGELHPGGAPGGG